MVTILVMENGHKFKGSLDGKKRGERGGERKGKGKKRKRGAMGGEDRILPLKPLLLGPLLPTKLHADTRKVRGQQEVPPPILCSQQVGQTS